MGVISEFPSPNFFVFLFIILACVSCSWIVIKVFHRSLMVRILKRTAEILIILFESKSVDPGVPSRNSHVGQSTFWLPVFHFLVVLYEMVVNVFLHSSEIFCSSFNWD